VETLVGLAALSVLTALWQVYLAKQLALGHPKKNPIDDIVRSKACAKCLAGFA
jgi:hypothetical protein